MEGYDLTLDAEETLISHIRQCPVSYYMPNLAYRL